MCVFEEYSNTIPYFVDSSIGNQLFWQVASLFAEHGSLPTGGRYDQLRRPFLEIQKGQNWFTNHFVQGKLPPTQFNARKGKKKVKPIGVKTKFKVFWSPRVCLPVCFFSVPCSHFRGKWQQIKNSFPDASQGTCELCGRCFWTPQGGRRSEYENYHNRQFSTRR